MVEIDNVIQEFEKPQSSGESVEVTEPISSAAPKPISPSGSARIGNLIFYTTGALTDNIPCTTSPDYPKLLIRLGQLPPTTEYFIPPTGSPIRADWHCEGWFCFYEYLFRFGMTIPLSPLSRDVMHFLGISPGQLMPAGWKLIQGLEELGRVYEAPIKVADLRSMYSSKSQSPGRVHFRVRSPANTLITIGQALNDERYWKAKYFFVKKESLGPECAYLQTC
jgi:hypothetical protein